MSYFIDHIGFQIMLGINAWARNTDLAWLYRNDVASTGKL